MSQDAGGLNLSDLSLVTPLATHAGGAYAEREMVVLGPMEMSRFQGKNRPRLIVEALRQQRTLACCEPAISKIGRVVTLQTFAADSRLTIQGSGDNRLAFIFSGRVEVLINGQRVAERKSGQHIGEMSVIDPSARRSATAVALERTTVAWIKEKDFSRTASSHPELWRGLAVELGSRLRERGALLRERNSVPEVFIGSSTESLKVATAIERALKPDPIHIWHWRQGVFGASEATIESLEKQLRTCDFAILILTADDKLRVRRKNQTAPRDNVVFELGLFMGAIGRHRTFMVVEDRKGLRVPADLHGITYLPIETKDKGCLSRTVNDVVSAIRKRISELNTR
jgi:CRP/FNR family transcriptional regulator, cyclic AMP receptor protein